MLLIGLDLTAPLNYRPTSATCAHTSLTQTALASAKFLSGMAPPSGPLLLSHNRAGWLHVVRGDVTLNRIPLRIGDAAAVSEEQVLELTARDAGSSEVLLFDLG
jgi:redox-sensitive bicupin YhaK (pirin superfamily)